MFIYWGMIITLSGMPPQLIGPYTDMLNCYDNLPARVIEMQTIDPKNQYRGQCFQFPRRGRLLTPPPDAVWLTPDELTAKANAQ